MEKRLNMRNKTIIGVVIFIAVFTVLLLVATEYDLEISKLLTENSLPDGAYISTNGFGLFFEVVGSSPIYIMLSIAAVILFWWGIRKEKTAVKIVMAVVGGAVSFIAMYMFIADIFGYIAEHMGDKEYMEKTYITIVKGVLTLIIWGQLMLLWKKVKPETNDKLAIWSVVIICSVAMYLVIEMVKSPVGRMRFRTMNAMGDSGYDGFTKWFVVNGKRKPTEADIIMYGVGTDAYKSFPSGHTFGAGIIYTLLCLPNLLERFNTKGWKLTLWFVTIGFTAAVAISRIVVGAHFLSDVLFGGTIAFMSVMIFREIFICKFSHFKCFKPETNVISLLEPENAEEVIEENEEVTETVAEDSTIIEDSSIKKD